MGYLCACKVEVVSVRGDMFHANTMCDILFDSVTDAQSVNLLSGMRHASKQ